MNNCSANVNMPTVLCMECLWFLCFILVSFYFLFVYSRGEGMSKCDGTWKWTGTKHERKMSNKGDECVWLGD